MLVKDYIKKLSKKEKDLALVEFPHDYIQVRKISDAVANMEAKEMVDFKDHKIIVIR